MAIEPDEIIRADDFVSTSSGASDEGKVVKLNASGQIPYDFVSGHLTLGSFTYTSGTPTEVLFTDLGGFDELLIVLAGLSTASAVLREIRVSTNNGSSYISTGYKRGASDTTSIPATSTLSNPLWEHISILRANKTGPKPWMQTRNIDSNNFNGGVIDVNDPINAVRVFVSSSNINGGSIFVYGKS
jgi:hypothetical protein